MTVFFACFCWITRTLFRLLCLNCVVVCCSFFFFSFQIALNAMMHAILRFKFCFIFFCRSTAAFCFAFSLDRYTLSFFSLFFALSRKRQVSAFIHSFIDISTQTWTHFDRQLNGSRFFVIGWIVPWITCVYRLISDSCFFFVNVFSHNNRSLKIDRFIFVAINRWKSVEILFV